MCLGGTTTLVFGCTSGGGDDLAEDTGETTSADGDGDGDPDPCADPFAGGTLVSSLGFTGEGSSGPAGVLDGVGHDARLALDLGTLTEDTLITANADFFVRTEYPDLLDPDLPWTLTLSGLVDADVELSLGDLAALPQVSRVVLLECSGNGGGRGFGLMSAAEWSGVLLRDVLALAAVSSAATAVLVEGFDEHSHVSTHSTPGCSWVFRLDEPTLAGAMLVTHMNGEPLPPNHGQPLRLIIPGWYGCCNAKWVNSIRLVDDGEPATAQMMEFASRTHQSAAHELAIDYSPAIMQQAAMPVRIEKWDVDGGIRYKIVGILWGGTELTDALAIQFDGGPLEPVALCVPQATNDTWTLWSHAWSPPEPGEYEIRMAIEDPSIPTIRLDSGFYARTVVVDEV